MSHFFYKHKFSTDDIAYEYQYVVDLIRMTAYLHVAVLYQCTARYGT